MPTSYRVYRNNSAGGPVDYAVVVATTAGLSWASPALGLDSDNKLAVRAFDTASGLEEQGVDAVVRIIVDASGADVTGRPAPPAHLSAEPRAAGGARVEWSHPGTIGGHPAPTGFRVWLTLGGTVNYAAIPTSTIPYAGPRAYSADLSGLTDGNLYTIGIRAYNTVATEPNTLFVQVTGDSTGPAAPEGLTATAVGED